MPRKFRGSAVRLLAGAALVLVLGPAGCGGGDGPAREPVSGTVTLDGKPVAQGIVTFLPAGPSATAGEAAIADGAYRLRAADGLAAGPYRVSISAPVPAEAAPARKLARGGPRPDPTSGTGVAEAPQDVPLRESIPAKYNAETTLQVEVKAGADNAFPFDLTTK